MLEPNRANRQIRVFISSTFLDMQAEQERLTGTVFLEGKGR
jgi:hypothetical protein